MKLLSLALLCSILSSFAMAQNTFPATGNVGIGATDLTDKLTVGEYGGSIGLRDKTTSTTGNSSLGRLNFYDFNGIAAYITLEHNYYFGPNPRAVLLSVNGAERMRINSQGYVGIGTSTPQAFLDINGKVRTSNNIKVFASDESWAEGLVLIKPSGWAGIRIARNDPITGNYEGNWALGYSVNDDFTVSCFRNGVQYDHLFNINSTTRNVGIGTSNPTEKLSVNGKIRAKEIRVENVNWPDYVFAKDYRFPSLRETAKYINTNGHLPEMPPAKEVATSGIDLGEMNAKLLKKIEELTLYLIQKDKEIKYQNRRLAKIEELLKKIR